VQLLGTDMCGIAGIVSWSPDQHMHPATIHQMCQTLLHRGPDDEGIYVNGGVGLGMRRLSIIDVAGGHQPIHNEDRTVWIVFNGEIYNFRDLRKELESRGHRFYTSTDTEAIVHLYEDLGSECVHKLRGMFAFAIYDKRRRSLLLARDRLGIKPLHYAWDSRALVFGSEIKAILAVRPELRQIDREAIREFFYFGYIPEPKTAFADIRKLPPGHILEFDADRAAPQVLRYWDLPEYGASMMASEQEFLEEMEWRLMEAVRIRLISDVPLGALLSGGTDSSVVVALMAQASSKPVKTFSIGFKQSDFNESGYAKAVAQKFGTDHHELAVEPDLKVTLNRLTSSLEEPFGDSSMLPTYFVCALARRHVTVALSGDGGDELFAGYERYDIHMKRRRFGRIPTWVGKFYRRKVFPRLPVGTRGRRLAYSASLPFYERYLDSISFITELEDYAPVLSEEFQNFGRNGDDPFNSFRAYLRDAKTHDDLSRILYLDTKTYLPSDILTKVDRMSMATSLEVRVPLLDHLFVEWATSLPIEFKWRGHDRQKILLKKLALRLGVPSQVLYRPKQGFALPLVHWMRNEIREEMARVLLDQRTLQRGYFNGRGIETLLDEHFRGRRDHSARLWLLLIFELWHRNFLEKLPTQATMT
jgi:asparagine synthase (glutamine-hydrolysing)